MLFAGFAAIAPFALLSLSVGTAALLILIALIAGIGITAIGPGGVLVTIGLFTLTDLSPAEVAGTTIVTQIGTGLVGTFAFRRSGQLRDRPTRRLAVALSVAALICTPLGVAINTRLSSREFGVMLAIFVMVIGLTVLVREYRRHRAQRELQGDLPGPLPQTAIGGVVGTVSGVFGLGGPMISVPLMAIAGFPLLAALAAAQAQSVVIASTGAVSYLTQGAIMWPLVVLVGVPQMIGVWLGWKVARTVPTRPLTYALGAVLILLGPVLLVNR